MFGIDETAWLDAMRSHATAVIEVAARQMGDPDAALEWREAGHRLDFARPIDVHAWLRMIRPPFDGERPEDGHAYFHILPYVVQKAVSRNGGSPLVDATMRKAVLRHVRGRARVAEIARLSPDDPAPAWAFTLDVLSHAALTHFLPQEDVAEIVASRPPVPKDPDDHPYHAIERKWHPYLSDVTGLHYVNLVPDLGDHLTDGIGFRLGGPGSPRLRVESDAQGRIHVEIHGAALPETVLVHAVHGPLSRILDDPALVTAARMLTVLSVSNHEQDGVPLVSVTTDAVRIRCAPAPVGASFSWETVRDPAAARPNVVRRLAYGSTTAE